MRWRENVSGRKRVGEGKTSLMKQLSKKDTLCDVKMRTSGQDRTFNTNSQLHEFVGPRLGEGRK